MANDQSSYNHTITYADPPNSSRFISTRVPISSPNEEIIDVAFVEAVGDENDPGGVAAIGQDFRFDHAVALGEHWAYKYLLDLDGMSHSGHFMGFVANDSVVLKATVYREYFSDWIQPWCAFSP